MNCPETEYKKRAYRRWLAGKLLCAKYTGRASHRVSRIAVMTVLEDVDFFIQLEEKTAKDVNDG